MRLGVHLVDVAFTGGAAATARILGDLARACDEVGVDVLSLQDHVLRPSYLGRVDEPVLEGFTTLGFLAARTSRVELQLIETAVTLRNPALLAKTVATLDVLSGGRARLGVGAGWYEREQAALGLPFPPLRERFEMLDEALRVVRQVWSADDGPFRGRWFDLAETRCSPRPLHAVPVMVGGTDERKALRLVARHADACHLFAGGDLGADWVAGRLAALRGHCADEGTSYDAIARTVMWTDPVGPGFVDRMQSLAEVGVDEVHVQARGPDPVPWVEGLAGVVSAAHALG
jgi:alkanesulfonate monooxygenase SsuD/methylene tetrahydromethanopterin reductase-like flavin-dependent oxidoreductase (luciferase family)